MKKSFALCEVFSLTPCPLSAEKVPSTLPTVAERGMSSKEAGGLWPLASLKNLPLPRPDDLPRRPSAAGGGGRGWGRVTAAGIFGAEGSSRSGLLCPGPDEGLELRCWHP